MHKKIEIIRWLLVIPSAFVGWYAALFMGFLLYSVADYFCPPELMISGQCSASWHQPVIDGVIIFGASLSAILVILFSVLVAPNKRKLVAKIIYLGGVLLAMYAVYETSAWGAFAGAVLSGALFLLLFLRFMGGKNNA